MRRPPSTLWSTLLALVVLGAACSADGGGTSATVAARPDNPAPSAVPAGPVPDETAAALDALVAVPTTAPPVESIEAVGRSGDVRTAWLLVDLLQFHHGGPADGALVEALRSLTGISAPADTEPWVYYADQLLVWDVPAPPGYFEDKRALYLGFDPTWEPFFDRDASLDWRAVSWSGARRDEVQPLVDPEIVSAEEGDWLAPDEAVVGVQIAGEARAYPRRVLVAHGVVTDGLGGRRITLPTCVLCGSAIGYYADETPEGVGAVELHSSGLVSHASSLLYDATTESLLESMRGEAVTGDLADAGLTLERFTVVATSWDAWRSKHPETTVVSQDGGVGRVYVPEPTTPAERWPSYPVGALDSRLDAHELVLVGVTEDGGALAFPVAAAGEALTAGRPVEDAGVEVVAQAGGLVLRDAVTGRDVACHEAYWFSWSLSFPETRLWDAGA